MTLTDLRYIVALARERHFGRAAERCHVSQPTLSVAVKKLEDELGVTLFERSAADVRITPIGEQIVEQASQVLNQATQIREIAQQGRDPLSGPLRLGVIYTVGPYLLPRLIPILRERAPAMPLVIRENYTSRLAEMLKRSELDVIVVAHPFAEQGVVTQPLYDEPFRVLMPRGHPWQKEKRIAPARLADEHLLLLSEGNCFREQVLQVAPGIPRDGLPEALEGSSLETIRHMVASGAGITVLPSSAVDDLPKSQPLIAVRPFADPQPSRRVALAWRVTFPRYGAIDVLRQAIIDARLPGVTPVLAGKRGRRASAR